MDNRFFSEALAARLQRVKTSVLSAPEAPAGYARQLGIPATEEEIRAIHRRTNGWTAAVAPYLENLREGHFENGSEDLGELVAATFWQKLDDWQRQAASTGPGTMRSFSAVSSRA